MTRNSSAGSLNDLQGLLAAFAHAVAARVQPILARWPDRRMRHHGSAAPSRRKPRPCPTGALTDGVLEPWCDHCDQRAQEHQVATFRHGMLTPQRAFAELEDGAIPTDGCAKIEREHAGMEGKK
jgi:hypothetical protein